MEPGNQEWHSVCKKKKICRSLYREKDEIRLFGSDHLVGELAREKKPGRHRLTGNKLGDFLVDGGGVITVMVRIFLQGGKRVTGEEETQPDSWQGSVKGGG